jgi:hypothetical protein
MKLWTKFKSLFFNEPRRPKVYWIAFPAEVDTEEDKQEIIAAVINDLQTKITII